MLPFPLSGFANTFLKNDILSIDIGFTNIKIVHARKKTGGKLKVVNFAMGRTPIGCIKNGVISNMEGIAENLKKVVTESRMNEKNVKIVISAGSNIISKLIYIPKSDPRRVELGIREEVSRQIPVNIQEQKLFYRITGEMENGGSVYQKVLVTLVPSSTIENYIKLTKLINFKPLSIEIPFSSVARFFSKGVEIINRDRWYYHQMFTGVDSGVTAVADLGSETTNLSILNEGALEFNRVILAGGRNLDEIIAGKLLVQKVVAENYKKMYGIVENPTGDEIEQVVDECSRYYMGEIFKNIRRSIEFYSDKCGGKRVERLVLIGGGSGLAGVAGFAGNIVELPVYTVDTMNFNHLEYENVVEKDMIKYLITALGIAM